MLGARNDSSQSAIARHLAVFARSIAGDHLERPKRFSEVVYEPIQNLLCVILGLGLIADDRRNPNHDPMSSACERSSLEGQE